MIDLILIHPPAFYDFRKRPGVYGPISDVVPSTPVFEMYPIGFVSLSEYLERHGLKVRIINVAMKMLRDKDLDVERLIKKNRAVAFGLDLHWMAHVQGALALAEMVKKAHPHTPIILGGLSATYYHEELLKEYPFIDFIVRGDSTEKPLLQLIRAIKGNGDFGKIPNITYRDVGNGIRVNPLTYVPEDLNEIAIDYQHIMKKVVRYADPVGYQPFIDWYTYPVTAIFTCRGCIYNCKTCGGSSRTFRSIANRTKPAFRDPKLLAQDIFDISSHLNAPIMVIGDIFQPGEAYGFTFLEELRKRPIKNHIAFEFFVTPNRKQLERIAQSVLNFNIEISPESHDEEVRLAFGRPYNNESLERMISDTIELGCKRIDIFFMIGLPKQTYDSVMGTVDYCRFLLERFQPYRGLYPFISPLAPFLDPGSVVFENPEKYGYRLLYRTLEEHRKALLSPSWKYILNYETEWMDREAIVSSTYEAGKRLNRIKAEFGLIDQKTADSVEIRIEKALQVLRDIDQAMAISDPEERERVLSKMMSRPLPLHTYSMSTVCEKKELEWPTKLIRMNLFKIVKTLLSRKNRRKGDDTILSARDPS